MGKSFSIEHTHIAPLVVVSSAAIHYDEMWGERWQYETWIFTKPGAGLSSRQVIHGSGGPDDERLQNLARKYHRRVVRILK